MFDTADVYSHGASEEILGEALKGRREQGADLHQGDVPGAATGPNDVGSSRYHLMRAVRGEPAAARHRLHRPLLQLHGFDALTPVEETLSARSTTSCARARSATSAARTSPAGI